jgi:hypothetical protein
VGVGVGVGVADVSSLHFENSEVPKTPVAVPVMNGPERFALKAAATKLALPEESVVTVVELINL